MNTRTPKTLTVEETNRLLSVYDDINFTHLRKALALRNETMLLFMLDAGLRVGELVQLRRDDLIVEIRPVDTICIRKEIAKNKNERYIPLTGRLRNAICHMRSGLWYLLGPAKPPYAFYCLQDYAPVSTRQVERIVKLAGMSALGRPVNPHMLRHTFASRLMRTTNARIVQELLGHKNLTSTQIYTHPNSDDLTKAIKSIEKPQ